MTIEVASIAQQPELLLAMRSVPSSWPEFMLHDPIAERCYRRLPEEFPELQLVATDGDEVVGRVNMAPFAWSGRDAELPDRGWDAVLEEAFADLERARSATAASLLEARIAPGRQGEGLSRSLLEAAKRHAADLGFRDLLGPVRPTGKAAEPHAAMTEYALRTRPDGLTADPWLRVHVRVGGRIARPAPASMTIPGTLAQWRAWTGLPLLRSGRFVVDGALAPVEVSVEDDRCVYVEPNVWVHHPLGSGR